jgi:hypothetical protein
MCTINSSQLAGQRMGEPTVFDGKRKAGFRVDVAFVDLERAGQHRGICRFTHTLASQLTRID